ncbi:UNVERIFIED_CONTAM: hypothetical protein H355_013669 [Colinus virginianus]|nr:hypothetical protein H355_013669 [Colinus virginianus]
MVTIVNAKADVLRATAALAANCNAAKGLQDVVKTNLGPKGTLKMLVGVQTIIMPFLLAYTRRSECVSEFRVPVKTDPLPDRELLQSVARTSLRTKVHAALADSLTDEVVEAVCLIASPPASSSSSQQQQQQDQQQQGKEEQAHRQIDLFMVEIIHMRHGLANETKLIKGLVMDHGARHPDMPASLKNCYILTCNVSLEYEKSEVNAGFFYSSAEEREKMAEAERRFTDQKVMKIIELKRKTLAENSGLDAQDCILLLIDEYEKQQQPVGLNLLTGQPFSPAIEEVTPRGILSAGLFLGFSPYPIDNSAE